MKKQLGFLWLVPVLAGLAAAAVHQIPYNGGKLAGSVVLSGPSVPATIGGQPGIPQDTVKIGSAVTVRFGYASNTLPAVCGAKQGYVVQILGAVWQTADTSSDWNGLGTYPSSGLVAVDSINAWPSFDVQVPARAPGFGLFQSGQNNTCSGEAYIMEPKWNRVVFLRYGSGIDYRVKLTFGSVIDTSYTTPPSYTSYHRLQKISLHYVLNANSTDLAGPVSLRPSRPARGELRFGARVEHDLYNPLGVRMKRYAGRYEPVLSKPRQFGSPASAVVE
jgi:hypothetical protein